MKSDRPLSRATAERLLDHTEPSSDDALSSVLAAASAQPQTPLAGEEAALSLFRQAAATGGVPAPTLLRTWVRKVSMAPIALAGAAGLALGGGGLALAAATGHLHAPFDHPDRAAPSSSPRTPTPPSAAPSLPVPANDRGPLFTPEGTARPALTGLCDAWRSGAHGQVRRSPSFAALVTAAGGEGRIGTFCAEVTLTTLKPLANDRPGSDAAAGNDSGLSVPSPGDTSQDTDTTSATAPDQPEAGTSTPGTSTTGRPDPAKPDAANTDAKPAPGKPGAAIPTQPQSNDNATPPAQQAKPETGGQKSSAPTGDAGAVMAPQQTSPSAQGKAAQGKAAQGKAAQSKSAQGKSAQPDNAPAPVQSAPRG